MTLIAIWLYASLMFACAADFLRTAAPAKDASDTTAKAVALIFAMLLGPPLIPTLFFARWIRDLEK